MASKNLKSFTKQVATVVDSYEARLRAIAKLSIHDTVEIAQKPTGAGGRMRIDTGFLQHSIAANIGALPSGDATPSFKDVYYSYTGTEVESVLARWNLDKTFYVGWVANYARPREHHDGFMRGAVEKWNTTVKKTVAKVRKRL